MAGIPFGKYRLIDLLGRGGMGEVWRAYDTVLDRIVAIKILPADTSRDQVFQQRFRREAHAAARLNSPHVIPIHTHGEIDGRLFVDMRLIEGRDLQSVLANGPPLAPERAVHIIEQVAKALYAAHRVGLLHRDVKPSNILLDDDDFAYLIDFGIARTAGELALTTAGDVVGTFHYMAPERFNSDQVDTRSDIYALTCVLYECLTRRHPFPGDTPEQQLTGHLRTPPPRATSTNPGLPSDFDTVIAKGMAKNPEQRYATTMELARAAREVVTTPITRPLPSVPAWPAVPSRAGAYPRPDSPPPHYPDSSNRRQPPSEAASVQPRQPLNQQPATTTKAPPVPWWRRKPVIITAAVLVVAAIVGAVSVATMGGSGPSQSQQVTLPFTGLDDPEGLSVDNGGTVYVADTPQNRVLALTAGSTTPAVLPFNGLNRPTGVTADNSGTVYVTDAGNRRVVTLPAGSTVQTQLPFTELVNPTGVTVDSSRTVYVTDTGKNQVVALPADSNSQTTLAFTGLSNPTGVVVNGSGTVYVADGGNNQVLALPAGSSTQTALPFTGLTDPGGVTVDGEGSVYVTDRGHNRVLKKPADSTTQVELPFTGLSYPWGLAVDSMGTVYVAGHNNKVVTLRQK
ncbi:MAG: protein kinase [Mycobacterium sp.]|nr:protein kinase [Mycobacterium sp.]